MDYAPNYFVIRRQGSIQDQVQVDIDFFAFFKIDSQNVPVPERMYKVNTMHYLHV